MKDQPRKLSEILPGLMRGWRLAGAVRITSLWPEVAGEAIARVSRPQGVRKNVLLVEVQDASWAQELALLRGQFLDRYRQLLPDTQLADIRFQSRSWYEVQAPGEGPAVEPPPLPPLPGLALNAQEQSEVDEQLVDVPEAVRESLGKLLSHEAMLAKARLAAGWQPCDRCRALHPGPAPTCHLCLVTGATT